MRTNGFAQPFFGDIILKKRKSILRCEVQEVQTALPIGSVIRDRYRVEDLLGRGGFGAVYLVRDLRVRGNLFAVKEITDSSKQEHVRFAFEGDVLKRLDHPALPRVYRVFEDAAQKRAYMLMDYIEGPNLETLRLRQPDKRFSLAEAAGIMTHVVQAVAYLHRQSPPIIHRDIKPANIIVPAAGDSAMLVDFGIAKEFDPDSTTTAVRRCSPGYGAPEQYSRGTETRTDIYGLGATFYALLAGLVPEDAFYRMTSLGSRKIDPLEPVNKIVPAIPAYVAEAIQKAMAINLHDRFDSVEEFWQALQAPTGQAAAATPVTPLPPSLDPRHVSDVNTDIIPQHLSSTGESVRHRRRGFAWPVLLVGMVVLALVLGAASAVFLPLLASHHGTPAPAAHHPSSTAGKPTQVATPTPTPTLTATASRAPTPVHTPVPPSAYPSVVGTHNGTAHNQNANQDGSLALALQQNQGNVSGTVTIGGALQGSGSIYNGFVRNDRSIQFTVTSYGGHAPLHFSGTVSSNGSMSGSYCSIDTAGRCNSSVGGYGSWVVGPSTSPSATGSSYTQPAAVPIRNTPVTIPGFLA
jgi:eukaryotic-like serine/threonine-protein kinase